MKRAICIHGHFYQPPRENPWLEDIELQDSALPFHDWNERITAECYEPNGAARILDDDGNIADIVNNYARISFNFGPTLLAWLERHHPETYQSILEADRRSRELFSGHGAALAQCYNHLIMPQANARDKRTQVLWGIADFTHRFGRRPEGMWLPETAVDLETLEVLAEAGIDFTILAPHQARRVRPIGESSWQEIDGDRVNPRRPYLCRLPSGKTICLFFYDGPISRDVAFAGLLKKGEVFAGRLLGAFSGGGKKTQLVHIATDGETYGHHHRFGEMALAYCLDVIESQKLAKITIYGEFMEKNPPAHEVEILENTSWSCAHGVERWRSDCGCRIGAKEGWHQRWRQPLREALDWLRDRLADLYEAEGPSLFEDPWQARDAYIEIILDRSSESVSRFLRRHGRGETAGEKRLKALRLLEMQRQAQLMFTSCGWFFDEVSGIETVQILAYAGRALQLAREVGGEDLEGEFLARLEKVPSNVRRWRNGARIYRGMVQPMQLDLIRVAAHHVIASQFGGDHKKHRIYCYRTDDRDHERLSADMMQLGLGRTHIRSEITGNAGVFTFAVLYLGGHKVSAGVRTYRDDASDVAMREEIREAFEKSDIPEVIRLMDTHFGGHNYSLWHLFRDEQRRILGRLMEETLTEIEDFSLQIYKKHFALLHFLQDINMPVPRNLAVLVEGVINHQLQWLFEEPSLDRQELERLIAEVTQLPVELDEKTLGQLAGNQLARQVEEVARATGRPELLQELTETIGILETLPFDLDLWPAQKIYFALCRPLVRDLAGKKDAEAEETLDRLRRLGTFLRVGID